MRVQLSFVSAVALAGLAYLVGSVLVRRVDLVRRLHLPPPLFGGFLAAVGLLLLRLGGVVVTFPTQGVPLDFLVGLLTTNMGLHVSAKVLPKALPVFLAFVGLGVLLFGVQLVLLLPLAFLSGGGLEAAILAGPVSFMGAPFNLNPPQQVPPIAGLFAAQYPNAGDLAKGVMMLGVITAVFVPSLYGHWLLRRVGDSSPKKTPAEKRMGMSVWETATHLAALVVLVLTLISLAFGIQGWLRSAFPGFQPGYLPVIIMSYLLAVAFRVTYGLVPGTPKFPQEVLNVLLFGPTMGLVLSYAVMSVPLHLLLEVPAHLLLLAPLALAASLGVAWVAFQVFQRLTRPFYAAIGAVVFLGITTGWGPVAMAYLRSYIEEDGPAQIIPAVLPPNAFYLFPWLVIWLTRGVFGLAGALGG